MLARRAVKLTTQLSYSFFLFSVPLGAKGVIFKSMGACFDHNVIQKGRWPLHFVSSCYTISKLQMTTLHVWSPIIWICHHFHFPSQLKSTGHAWTCWNAPWVTNLLREYLSQGKFHHSILQGSVWDGILSLEGRYSRIKVSRQCCALLGKRIQLLAVFLGASYRLERGHPEAARLLWLLFPRKVRLETQGASSHQRRAESHEFYNFLLL